MASAKFQLSANGGISWLAPDVPLSSGLGLAQVGGNASVYARLASTAGVDTVAWSIVSASENAAELSLVTYPDRSVHILVPLDSAASWLLRAVVNGGIDPLTRRATPDLVSALAIKVLTTGGLELLAPGEGDEGDRAFGWTTAFNALASAGIGAGTATRIRADANGYISGDTTLASGTNVTLAQVGSTITINASGGGGGALPSPYTATLATVDGKANSLLITAPTVSAIDAPQVYIKGVGAHELTPDDVFGGDVIIEGGDTDATDAGSPGRAILRGGLGTGIGQGGTVSIEGRDATVSGGTVEISSGDASAPGGNSGSVAISSGSCLGQAGDISVGGGSGETYGGNLYLQAGPASAGQGGFIIVKAGSGTVPGQMQFDGCDGVTNGIGGPSRFSGGAGNGSGAGGLCSVAGGAGGATGNGGALALAGGASTGGTSKAGGAASLTGGAASGTTGAGGAASVVGGAGTSAGGAAALTGGAGTVLGGLASLKGGAGPTGGIVDIQAGASSGTNAAGVNVQINGGTPSGTGLGGSVYIAGAAGTSTGTGGYGSLIGGGGGVAGGVASVIGGAGTATNSAGGNAQCRGGAGTGTGLGGGAQVTGGAGGTTGHGGGVTVTGGAAGASGTSKVGGTVSLIGGASAGTSGAGGSAIVSGGTGASLGGEVLLTPGLGASSVAAKTRVTRGAFQVEESTAVVKQISETCPPVTTTSTTATLVWSYPLGTSEILAVTVEAVADPGTAATAGLVAYKAVFRRTTGDNSGAAQQVGTTQDMSPAGNVPKSSFALTIALNGNAVEVKVVAPNATSTLWAVAVGGLARTGPV